MTKRINKVLEFAVTTGSEPLRRILSRRSPSQDLDDLQQEVYLRLLRMNPDECVRDLPAYLNTVASRVAADNYARSERQRDRVEFDSNAVEEAGDPADAMPDDMAERDALRHRIEQALAQLSPRQAQVLVLLYQEGLKHTQIAEQTGLSGTSIDKYVTRAKARMRKLLWDI